MASDQKVFVRRADSWEEVDEDADAAALSRAAGTLAVEWQVQTVSNFIGIECYRKGKCVRSLKYLGEEGWTQSGKPMPFEQTELLAEWLRDRRVSASPDGYAVLDCFLGVAKPKPVPPRAPEIKEQGANQVLILAIPIAGELVVVAQHHAVSVSRIAHAAWEVGKLQLGVRLVAESEEDPFYRVKAEDVVLAPPAVPGELVHAARELPVLELGEHKVRCELVVPPEMRNELVRVAQLFDRSLSWMFEQAWLEARPQLALA